MAGNFPRIGDPEVFGAGGAFGDVVEGAAEMAQAEGLTDNVRMQRDSHHEGLILGLALHFSKLIDDHVGEVGGAGVADGDRWNIVQFLGVRNRQNPPRPRLKPDRLIIATPVQQIGVAGFLE